MIFKEIPLLPTNYWLDFWCFDSKEEAVEEFSKRYGASKKYYKKWITPNQVCIIRSKYDSELHGEERIIMNVSEMTDFVIIHEIVHVIFYLCKHSHVEMGFNSQEWIAYMSEYIFNEIKKEKVDKNG